MNFLIPGRGGPQPFCFSSFIPFSEPISFVTFVVSFSGSSRNNLTESLSAARPRFLLFEEKFSIAMFKIAYVTQPSSLNWARQKWVKQTSDERLHLVAWQKLVKLINVFEQCFKKLI